MAEQGTSPINGIDTDALRATIKAVAADPPKGAVKFQVTSNWLGQCKTHTEVTSYSLGGQEIERKHTMLVDEPVELLGENAGPNPQEILMGALNSCIMVGYVFGASMKGIKLEKVEIVTKGALDLRGFLGIDASIPAGYETISYQVTLKGDGTKEQFEAIHQNVMATSPNYFNFSRPVKINAELLVE